MLTSLSYEEMKLDNVCKCLAIKGSCLGKKTEKHRLNNLSAKLSQLLSVRLQRKYGLQSPAPALWLTATSPRPPRIRRLASGSSLHKEVLSLHSALTPLLRAAATLLNPVVNTDHPM